MLRRMGKTFVIILIKEYLLNGKIYRVKGVKGVIYTCIKFLEDDQIVLKMLL